VGRGLSIVATGVLVFKVICFVVDARCLMVWVVCLVFTGISGKRAWRCTAEIDCGKRGEGGG
jgi:hypothetical protein